MRLIDADALGNRMYHESFEKDYDLQRWDGGCWIRYKLFEQVLREMPTIEPQEWVSCSERLPEDEQVVLVQDTEGSMWIWKYFSENLKYRSPYQWEDENGEWQLIDEVVAWMPLPEPYKEEQHE